MIVVDASVILKWVFREERGSAEALRLREHHLAGRQRIAVPDLLYYEAANAFVCSGRLDIEQSRIAWCTLLDMDLKVCRPRNEQVQRAIELGFVAGISAYDGAYVALAEAVGTVMMTADHKLARKLEKVQIGCRILTL